MKPDRPAPLAALALVVASAAAAAQSLEAPSPPTLLALESAAGGAPVALALPPARSFCSSPREAWIRARVRPALPPCDARGARFVMRSIDRSFDRLDAEWTDTGDAGVERARHGAWVVGDYEVFPVDDPRARDLASDVPRGPRDAWRAALLLVAPDDACTPWFDEAPAGLGAAGERVPPGVRGAERDGFHALVWMVCAGARNDVPGAVRYDLASVQTEAGRGASVRIVARYARGAMRGGAPPTR